MARWYLFTACVIVSFGFIRCPPVNPQADGDHDVEGDPMADPDLMQIEYQNYLSEVVSTLEKDSEFKKMLDASNTTDFETGNIAHYLEFASSHTRSKLDELKRIEVRRLRELHMKQMKENMKLAQQNGHKNIASPSINMEHVLHEGADFKKDDLAVLIKKTTEDLHDLDKKRRDNFKEYEMTKEHKFREEIKHMNDTEAEAKAKAGHEAAQKRHEEHPKIHHPGNKEQLEEVWEKEDHMEPESFDSRTFFNLHDINGDGFLDEGELEALFTNELDKVYGEDNPDDDQVERFEEMARMREHVMNEIDTNNDMLVSLDEFLASTDKKEFNEDEEWKTIDDSQEYTGDEMDAFEKALEAEQMKLNGGGAAISPDHHEGAGPPADPIIKVGDHIPAAMDHGAAAPVVPVLHPDDPAGHPPAAQPHQ